VVGDSDASGEAYAQALRGEALRRDLPVTFTGHLDDMRDVYASSNLVLSLSSHPESFGRTVAEALSMGVPVVGYDHGGVGEVLASAFPEGRVAAGDEDALFERVCALRRRPLRPQKPLAFTLDAMLERTLTIYEELAGPPARS
jgi:glycosyltransferase involved in cell wall biosynthesis